MPSIDYRDILDHVSGAVVGVVDTDGKFLFLNAPAKRALGDMAEELERKGLVDGPWFNGNSASRARTEAAFRRAVAGESSAVEAVLIGGDKVGRDERVSLNPVFGSDGKVAFVVIEVIDHSEMRRVEESLLDAQAVAHIGSWEWDVTSNTVVWSDELYRIYDVDKSIFKATFESFLALIHPEDREMTKKIIEQSFATKQPFDYYHRIVTPKGEEKILNGRGKVYTDTQGNVIRMAGASQDVTESKRREAVIEARTKELEQINSFMTGRELKMTELKAENARLKQELEARNTGLN